LRKSQDLFIVDYFFLVVLLIFFPFNRTLSPGQHPMYSIKLMPPQNTDHHRPSAAPPQPKFTERRIIRRQLGGGLSDSLPQQRSQYPDPDPASRHPEPTIRTTDAEEERPFAAAAGDSEDDEATLVSSSDAHVCQDSRDAEGVLLKDNGRNHVRISLLPFCSLSFEDSTLSLFSCSLLQEIVSY
jgi:hypothetical protein